MSSVGASRTYMSAAVSLRRASAPVWGPESANWGMRNSLVTAQAFWCWFCDDKYSSMRMHVTCDQRAGGVRIVLWVAGVGAGFGGGVVAAYVV